MFIMRSKICITEILICIAELLICITEMQICITVYNANFVMLECGLDYLNVVLHY
jgi:hypothetical protein